MSEMCRYVSTCGAYLMRGKEAIKKRADVCPKNTNDKCEIIPKKPKMVRVKAWAYRGENEGETPGWHCVPEEYEGSVPLVPCTILISEKYLRRKP